MTISPATNVVDAYKQCNPDYALPANDNRYTDLSEVRGEHGKIINTIQRSIARSDNDTCTHFISGHRGSGKTTELYRLQEKLNRDEYFCVYFDVGNALDLADISYIDIFLAMIDEISKALQEQQIDIAFNDEIIKDIYEWVYQEVYKETLTQNDVEGNIKAGVDAKVGIPLLVNLLGSITGDIKHSQSQRISIRENIEKKASDFIAKTNQFLITVRNKLGSKDFKDIIMIVDGLEKIHYRTLHSNQSDSHKELFIQHAEQLLALQCHVVYTIPISLTFSNNLYNDYKDVHVMPMIKLNEQGVEALKTLVKKRVNIEEVFTNVALVDELIKNSGGVVRDLMRLVRLACDTDDNQITEIEIKYAISKLTKEYDRLLQPDDVQILRKVHSEQRVHPDSERVNQLLNNRIILEYENGERSAKIHPACLNIEWLKNTIDGSANDGN